MTAILLAAVLVAVAALVVGAVALVTLLRRTAAPSDEQSRQLLDEARSQAASERDAAIRAALEQSAVLNREALGAQVAATHAELDAKKALIDARLEAVSDDMGAQLSRVEAQLTELSRSNAVSLGQVSEQLQMHASTTRSLADTTQGLREALANSKTRGQWGERMAEDVLRLAGFVEHINYEKQIAVEGGRSIPDFTFMLGAFGESALTGKPVGDDLREGKPTPMLAIAASRAGKQHAELLHRVGAPDLDEDEVAALQAVIVDTGAQAEAEEAITALTEQAVRAIAEAPVTTTARDELIDLAYYVAWRQR